MTKTISPLNLDHPRSLTMLALLALEKNESLARYIQSKDGLVLYRSALNKLVKLEMVERASEPDNWSITDLGKERVAQWRSQQEE
jgi:hypothetical protein